MVAYLEKSDDNTWFHQIVDFLSSCSITYALTVIPIIYASYIEQFWNTASSKIVNFVKQIHVVVDGKAVVISESLLRSDLLFNDEDGITCLTNDEIFENLALMGYEPLSTKLTFQKDPGAKKPWEVLLLKLVTDTSLLVNHNVYMASSSAPQIDYAPMVQHSSEYTPPETRLVLLLQEYSPPETGLVVLVFQKKDDPIDAINHMMSFLTAVVTSSDEINTAKTALMANFLHYVSDNLAESNTEIASDSNIISYSQYMHESIYNTIQNSTLPALQDDLILSLLHNRFQMSSVGELTFFLGLQARNYVSHMHAVKRIFRYLKGHPTLGLWYPKDSPLELIAYSDSDYAGASLDRKSTTGGYQFLGTSAQTRSERVLEKPNEPPLTEGHTSGSGKGRLEENIELTDIIPTPYDLPLTRETELSTTKAVYNKDFVTLTNRVKKLESRLKKKRSKAIIHSSDEEGPSVHIDDSPKQGRIIEEMDKDENINLVSEQGDVQETAEHLRGDDDETLAKTLLNIKRSSTKDKGKGVMQETELPKKLKKKEIIQLSLDEELAQKLYAEELAKEQARQEQERYNLEKTLEPFSKAEVRKNMIMYLKNQGGYKQSYFKRMKYKDIKPLFERIWDQIYIFLPKDSRIEREVIKRAGFDLQQGSLKKQRPFSKAEVRKNMIMYLKNQGGYKQSYFKRMKYKDIKPLFERIWDQIYTFLPKDSNIEREVMKRAGFDLQQGSLKKQREDLEILWKLVKDKYDVLTEREIIDEFPDEHLMMKAKLTDDEQWYADYVSYIVRKVVPTKWLVERRRWFYSQVKNYLWDETYAFKLCTNNLMRRCVAGSEILKILAHYHSAPTRGHHSSFVTRRKVYKCGFFWRNIFKDAKDYVMRYDACQRSRNISARSEMPQNNIQVSVDYVCKWVEAQALPTNDARVVVMFLRGLFARFEVPKALISDKGTHFCAAKKHFMELNELVELRDGAYEKTRIYKERTKMRLGKLKSKWYGPNVVKMVYPYGAVEITDKNGFSFKVNGQRLKKVLRGKY
nr:reverse transcriptase domain-containing protein [Tanacetum cinerariifolium]